MKRGSSRLVWLVKAPLRALCRARDLYVRGITGCAGRVSYAGAAGFPVAGVPRSFSYAASSRGSSSGEDDLRELIRAASQGALGSLNLGGGLQPGGGHAVARSQSVGMGAGAGMGMGRIDEDRPYSDLGEDAGAGALHYYPRSRSCAVPKRKVGVMP